MCPAPKQVMREAMLATRRSLPPEDRAARSLLVARRVLALEAFERAGTVALYAAMGAEVETAELARTAARLGKRIVYPRIDERDRPLVFAAASLDQLVPGGYRSREPPASAPTVLPSEIDLVIVPGIAFDARCRRLGRGRGHYDATLALLRPAATRVGLAFDVQVVPEVPEDPHDAPLDVVVTESRVFHRLRKPEAAPTSSH